MDSPETLLILIVVFVFLIIFAAGIIVGIRADRKRTEALQQLASEMGYTFSKEGGTSFAETAAATNFELFRRGHSQKTANLIQGRREDFDLLACDYLYVTGYGKNRTTHRQTVAVMKLEQPQLAVFNMRPESLFDKLANKFGKIDINFESRPEFSRRYHLTGDDEMAVRRLFSEAVMEFCEGQKNLSLEASPNSLMIYYSGWRAKPEELRAFLDTAVNVLSMLRRPTLAGWGDLYDFGQPSKN